MSRLKDLLAKGKAAAFAGRRSRLPQWIRLTRQQMDLLWMDRNELAALKVSLGNLDVPASGPRDNGGVRVQKQDVTVRDIEWAERVMTIAEQAHAASQENDYAKAIENYRKALQQAPDCDLYLMSIGACYANMGQPARGLPYLKRAAKINPDDERIQHNLAVVRQMLGK
jgi:tetratricopeptide (TPR) repeat protein